MVRTSNGSVLKTRADGTIPFEGGKISPGTHVITLTKTGYAALRNYAFVIEKYDGQEILIEMQSNKKNITPGLVENITTDTPDPGAQNLQEISACLLYTSGIQRKERHQRVRARKADVCIVPQRTGRRVYGSRLYGNE